MQRFRTCLLFVVAFLALAFGGLYLYGVRLPREHRVEVAREVPAELAAVWARVSNPAGSEAWRTGVESVERDEDRDGRPTWREETSFGPMVLVWEQVQPPAEGRARLVASVADQEDFGGTWTTSLEALEGGTTRVTVVEDGWIESPIFRVFGNLNGLDGTATRYLDDLARSFEGE